MLTVTVCVNLPRSIVTDQFKKIPICQGYGSKLSSLGPSFFFFNLCVSAQAFFFFFQGGPARKISNLIYTTIPSHRPSVQDFLRYVKKFICIFLIYTIDKPCQQDYIRFYSLICIFIAIQNYKYSGDLHLQKQVGLQPLGTFRSQEATDPRSNSGFQISPFDLGSVIIDCGYKHYNTVGA